MKTRLTSNGGSHSSPDKLQAPEIPFGPPPRSLELIQGAAHVFCSDLDQEVARLDLLAKTLADDEHRRAARYSSPLHRNRFIAGRGILRELLGWLLHADPARLVFAYGEHGKPRLATPVGARLLEFNLAHCEGLAVYLVSASEPVGIDVERIREVLEAESVMSRFFSPHERAEWSALPDQKKRETFFQIWTRKESLLKAIGIGLLGPLHLLDCLPPDDSPGQMTAPAIPAKAFANYYLHTFVPASGYITATATMSPDAPLCWRWPAH